MYVTAAQMSRINSKYVQMLGKLIPNGTKTEDFHFIYSNERILRMCKQRTFKHMLQDIKKVILVILLVNPTSALRNNSSLTSTKEQKLADQTKHSRTKSWSTPNRRKINSTKMRYKENVMDTINQQWIIAGCHQEDDSAKDPSTSTSK